MSDEQSTKLALGTVQLGVPYGAANTTGLPSESDALRILAVARELGITQFDTASAYGLSEERIGLAVSQHILNDVHVITKIDHALLTRLHDFQGDSEDMQSVQDAGDAAAIGHTEEAGTSLAEKLVDTSVHESLKRLQLPVLPVLLLHKWEQRDAAWQRMLHWRDSRKRVRQLGTSTYYPEQVIEALSDADVKHIQLPLNLLDWRWRPGHEAGGADVGEQLYSALAQRSDVCIHARSAYLQGILVCGEERWPQFARDDGTAARVLAALDSLVASLGRKSRADLCLSYVRSLPWVSAVLVGAETEAQLRDNVELCKATALTASERTVVEKELPRVSVRVLDPSQWEVNPTIAGSYRKK